MKVWKVILAALVIFGAGVVTGGLTVRLKVPVERRPRADNVQTPAPAWVQQRVDMLARIERKLDLTPRQRQRIEVHVKESQQRMRDLWDPVAPKAREEARRLRERIASELTPEQVKQFDEVLKPRRTAKPADRARDMERRENDATRRREDQRRDTSRNPSARE